MADLHKTDIAQLVGKQLKGSPAAGEESLNAVLDAVQSGLKRGDRVVVTGFGAFQVRQVKQRSVRSIGGGGLVVVPAHKRVGFRAGAELAAAVRKPSRSR
ncbi:MAG: HU family DNA-binding protein [Dehalococcoidia bacterium]|nr:HU family DNA-binding protein [Dehalococcoidia bacterium]